ncbi:hypothetical protein R5W23_005714 [Gemmata sp. JC673]|uniref:Phage metallopeptidase domain-containing protein n=1 Tax=Gemmata algarum TaxID=2975278 RepID=A0ABU5EUE4_9BACT|nr:hypothetical protein [Gemmata algarum]MDY3558593.1 hypothetical protein [Gemmata algarum]
MRDIARQFKRHFDQTWRRLSPQAKGPIAEYLRRCPGTAYLCFRMDHDDQAPFGRCAYAPDRTAVTFLAPYFSLTSPDEVRVAVIAHELTHIYRRGTGEWTPDGEVEEAATRAKALDWGFDAPSFRDAEHMAGWNEVLGEWQAAHRDRFGKELESRWLGRVG